MNRKLIVFVPPEALEVVREAVFEAGAGRIGGLRALLLVHGGDGHVRRRRRYIAGGREAWARGARA